MTSRQDLKLYETGFRQQWSIPDEYRTILIKSMMRIITDPQSSNRDKIAASKVVLAANAQNQTDDIFVNGPAEPRGNRFLNIAERLGIVVDSQVVQSGRTAIDSDAVGESDAEPDQDEQT
jgi:hypothetical protein